VGLHRAAYGLQFGCGPRVVGKLSAPWVALGGRCHPQQARGCCSLNAPFLRALDGLVRSHPEIFFRELSSIFKRLAVLPDSDERWPTSSSSLGEVLRLIGFSVKKVERLASERSLALVAAHCRLARHIPDRCIVVADETHIHGEAMIRPRGRSLVGQPLEALAPDPRPRQRFSSIVAISHNTGILELTVNEVPPAQCGDDWVGFCTSLAGSMNGYVPGALWEDQPPDVCFFTTMPRCTTLSPTRS